MKLEQREILITGGGSGIGLALARRLIACGNRVLVCGRRLDVLQEAKRETPQLETIQCDLSQHANRQQLVADVLTLFPRLSVLVNNAGVQFRPASLLEQFDTTDDEEEFSINYFAPLGLTKLLLPHLAAQPESMIVNVTSGLAFAPLAFMANYCASKAALHSWIQSLRHQLRDTSIRIVEMIPPKVNTDLGGKGLHGDGVALESYVEDAFNKLCEGKLEFGYGSSEEARTADRNDLKDIFRQRNQPSKGSV
jgi:uncharacterized oxidoreductase